MAVRDLTTCKPASGLIRFAIPLILGNMFQQLYNLVDTVIVGNYCGPGALAAVGASNPVLQLFTCISVGGGIGASVIIGQMYGARQFRRMMTAIKTAVVTFFVIGAVLMTVGIVFHRPILAFMRTPENVLDDSALYMRIYFYGFLFTMMFNIFNAVFNAMGDSKKTLLFLAVSSVLNIFLNIYFITQLGMTVDGVAWATVISQGVAVILTLIVLIRKLKKFEEGKDAESGSPAASATKGRAWFDTHLMKTIFKVAGPSIIQQSIVALGLLAIQSVINGFGDIAMAGYVAANKIDLMAILPMSNMGNAVSTFTAQNIGARKIERIPQGLKAGLMAVVVSGLCIAAILFIFGSPLVGLFVKGEGAADVIAEGARYLKISSGFYFVFGAMNSFCGVLRGAGDMKGFLIAYLINFGGRVGLVFAFAAGVGLYMVAWCTVISWALALVYAAIWYKTDHWKTLTLI